METDKRYYKMRSFINILALIALIPQIGFSVFSALSMKKPETVYEKLYEYFILTSLLCSDIVVLIFFLIYNSRHKYLSNNIFSIISLIIAVFAAYVYIYQILFFNDMKLLSCVLLLIDGYVVYRVNKNILQ